ncbi:MULTISPECIES: hypothetical protein [unclassified Chryseobacterium]|uniref:hypothetical protein n=1 Tax=unclassified Chryseobacterium TaxID=2593645 RepID=UPI000B2C37B9|nr:MULTISPECIES: hypothetical protein [unclassified Chryseobacterium]
MARIQTDHGDYYGGIESSLEAEKYLKDIKITSVRENISRNYNSLALASSRLSNYED